MTQKPKANSIITSKMMNEDETAGESIHAPILRFTVKDVGVLDLHLANLHADVLRRAMIHGLTQRIQDAAAIARDTETGRSATAQEKYDAMSELVEHYASGTAEWSRNRQAPGVGADSALLVKCLTEVYPERTVEQLRAWVGKRSKAERTGLLLSEKIKPIADRIRAASASAVSADDLLMDLETGE